MVLHLYMSVLVKVSCPAVLVLPLLTPTSSVPTPPPNVGQHAFVVSGFPPPRTFNRNPKRYGGNRQKGSDFDLGTL